MKVGAERGLRCIAMSKSEKEVWSANKGEITAY